MPHYLNKLKLEVVDLLAEIYLLAFQQETIISVFKRKGIILSRNQTFQQSAFH